MVNVDKNMPYKDSMGCKYDIYESKLFQDNIVIHDV